ncbi:MAG: hypothetical protein H6713_35165 [Myxococcales bacterium]|nr:hypothetical protein [Myxococcales bacterium]
MNELAALERAAQSALVELLRGVEEDVAQGTSTWCTRALDEGAGDLCTRPC